jgi:lipopolysaccharide biosynthesis regulator YciM
MGKLTFRRHRLPQDPEEVLTLAQRLVEVAKPYLKWALLGAAGLAVVLAAWGINARLKAGREERAAAALAQVAPRLVKADLDAENLKALERLIKDHPGTRAGQEAGLLRAHLLYRLNRFAEAAAAYESLLGRDPGWDLLIQESLSYCYEGQGEWRKAAEVLKPLSGQASDAFRSELLLRQARLLERAGDRKEAGDLWRQLLERSPSAAMVPYLQEKAAATQAPEKK